MDKQKSTETSKVPVQGVKDKPLKSPIVLCQRCGGKKN